MMKIPVKNKRKPITIEYICGTTLLIAATKYVGPTKHSKAANTMYNICLTSFLPNPIAFTL